MKNKKGLLTALAVLLAVILGALVWVLVNYHVVNFRLYPKNAAQLDLRGQEFSVEEFDTLREKMPDCDIRWDVPFQGGLVKDDVTELTLTSLSAADAAMLEYLPELKVIDAQQCTDYDQLQAFREQHPAVEVNYDIHFSGDRYPWDAEEIVLSNVSQEDSQLLKYLPDLKTVAIIPKDYPMTVVAELQWTAHDLGMEFGLVIGGNTYLDTEESLRIPDVTDEELRLLPFLSNLKELCLVNPKASLENLLHMQESYNPEAVAFSWEVEIGGLTFGQDATEVDLSMVVIEDLAEVEAKVAYLPNVETVTFGVCGIDNPKWENSRSKLAASPIENEDMAAYRDRVRDQYKVVWTLRLGPSIALRSDADNFMPNHFGVGQLFNDYAYNLRYCEDMVCLDVGHMTLTDISFVEYMPKLKYLILAWTEVQYIEPIRTCKNLIFLEVDNSCIRDYSPIADCTALEDLNLGNTFCDITPILEMTWLKNLYMIFGNGGDAWKATQALPNTRVVASGDATVGSGWRRLQNYYDMRDCLGMYYMN